jgi:antitoxin component of MazEF toxin-antitoxin module
MVYLGRAKYSIKTGVYIPLIVAENMELKDGDKVEFHIENQELIIRKSLKNGNKIKKTIVN